jgi:hypothetical protein
MEEHLLQCIYRIDVCFPGNFRAEGCDNINRSTLNEKLNEKGTILKRIYP